MRLADLRARAESYAASEPGQHWPASIPWIGPDGRLYGMWILGQDYRSRSGYHGSYPPNYLLRLQALFPDLPRVLHLFSGALPPGPYTRFDLRDDVGADVVGNAERLAEHFSPGSFDLICADPPYTDEDARHYGTPPLNRNLVVRQTALVLAPGGWLAWLDQALPMYRGDQWCLRGLIGVVRSTNHRFRCATLFERKGGA